MYECRAILVHLLEIDHEFGRVVFREGEHLRAEERDDMVRDHVDRLGLEVRVVDTKVGVEPVDLVRDQLARDESLTMQIASVSSRIRVNTRVRTKLKNTQNVREGHECSTQIMAIRDEMRR